MSLEVQQMSLEKEYEKHKNISPEYIKQLREWLKSQPHLPEEHITDLDLILAYYCCEASDLVTKQVIDLHYTLRTLYTRFFSNRMVDDVIAETLQNEIFYPLPEHDINGERYLYCALRRSEPKYFVISDCARILMMIIDLWQYEEGTWPGFNIVIDMDLVVFGHIPRLELSALRQIIYFVQECMLVKLKTITFINAPSFIDKILMIVKPLMKKELFNKLVVYDRNADLSATNIPIHCFPKESGGKYFTCQEICDSVLKRLQSNSRILAKDSLKRVNESLRPFKSQIVEEEIGVGSFKKLDID